MVKTMSKLDKSSLNVVEYAKKLKSVYEDDKLLGTVTIPWGITFTLWLFTRSSEVADIITPLSWAMGLVALASAIKHIIGDFLKEKYTLEATKLNDNHATIKTQTDTQANKEIAESHYQMETVNMFAKSTNGTTMILLNRAVEYLKTTNPDPEISLLYANTIVDLNKNMAQHIDNAELPFKKFVHEVFKDLEEDNFVPTSNNIPKLGISTDEIKKLGDKITSSNPTPEDMPNISEDVSKLS